MKTQSRKIIPLSIGELTELDLDFSKYLKENLPKKTKVGAFVKTIFVKYFKDKEIRQEQLSEAEIVRKDLEKQIEDLRGLIKNIKVVANGTSEHKKEVVSDDKETLAKVRALTDVF
jgi:hypothetical protein